MYFVQKHPTSKGCNNFRQGELKKGGENMHFDASDPSIKMMMAFISSANDICMLQGICDYLGKRKQDDLESRKDSASIVLVPRVSETASLSRASVVDNLTDYARIAEEHLSARASIVECDLFSTRATTEAFVERANVTRDKELVRLCGIADHVETLNIGQHLQKSPARNSTGKLCTLCGEVDRPTSSTGGR